MYLQDVHIENFASRGKDIGMYILMGVFIVLTLASLIIGMGFPVFYFGVVVFALLAWYVSTKRELDFDYAYTDGTIDIAKVFNKSSRKEFLTFEMKDVVAAAPVGSEYLKAYQGRGIRTIDASARNPQVKTFEIVFRNHSGNNSENIVLMDLEDDFIDAMRQVAPDAVHKE
ncbi:MAG: hypothetical protein FRC54_08630 [bacterium LCO1.1]|uniref:Uncharacterized protein n=1 Tax=Candidatus Weimeria bifida TaxID=2599074 RepID=A0A6N7J2W9_9FIRM|nr:hypothetical protein [Candidatus Weimeria bifida]